jgi:DNA polymerase V
MMRATQELMGKIEQPSGFPSPAAEYKALPLDLNLLMIQHPAATFTFQFRGDHGTAYKIQDGDLLVVDRAVRPVPGQLVIAERDGERIIKRLQRNERVRVLGVVLWVLKAQ